MKTDRFYTAKFGGSSLRFSEQVDRVRAILNSYPHIRAIVVSAPGGVTKLLRTLAKTKTQEDRCSRVAEIVARYQEIIDGIGVGGINTDKWADDLMHSFTTISEEYVSDYIASRGEHYMAILMAKILDCDFVDASKFMIFNKDGVHDIVASEKMVKKIGLRAIAKKNASYCRASTEKCLMDKSKPYHPMELTLRQQ